MSYNAGSIESKLELDKSPFSRTLRDARAEADAFERRPIKAKIELDRTRAEAELRAFEARMATATRTRTAEIRVETRDSAARLRDLQNQINGVPVASRRASEQTRGHMNVIRLAIETLLPPLIPLAGGLAGLATGAATFLAVGVGAFAAVKNEIKTGTQVGAEYNGQLQRIKQTALDYSNVLAKSTQSGFNATVDTLVRRLPAANSLIQQSGQILGSTVQHAVSALVGGLVTFQPLILDAERAIERAAAATDRWASSAGAGRFVQTLQHDLALTIPFLREVGTLIAHLLSGASPMGEATLTALTGIAHVINSMPVGVLQALLTTYLTFRAAVAVTAPLNAASAALTRFAAAEEEAAVAGGARGGGGISRGLAGALGVVRGFAFAATATVLAAHAAGAATDRWAASTNNLKYNLHAATEFLSHMPWNAVADINRNAALRARDIQLQQTFGDSPYYPTSVTRAPAIRQTASNLSPMAAVSARQLLQTELDKTNSVIIQATATKDALWQRYLAAPRGAAIAGTAGHQQSLEQKQILAQYRAQIETINELNQKRAVEVRGIAQTKLALSEYTNTSRQYVQATEKRNSAALAGAYRETAGQSLSSTSGALSDYINNLQKAIVSEQKWTDASKGNTVSLGGVKYSTDAAAAAIQQAGGNTAKAAGILEGHREALLKDQEAMKEVQDQQSRINASVGDAATKYGLTTDQVNLYAEALGITAQQLGSGAVSTGEFIAAVGRVKEALRQGNTTVNNWVAAVDAFNKSGDTAASRAQLLGAALISFNGDAISYGNSMAAAAVANKQLIDDFSHLQTGILNVKTGFIDYHNAGAAPILADLAQLQSAAAAAATATYQHEVAIYGEKQAAKDAADVFRNDTHGALVAEATQLGLTKGQADKLANRYFNWPKNATTQIEALGGAETNTLLDAIGRQLSYLTGHPWTFTIDATTTPAAQHALNVAQGLAGRGVHGHTIANGGIFEYYAAGGRREDHRPQIVPAGSWRVFGEPETAGEAYIPLADDWRRSRAKDITQTVAAKLGGVAYFAAGGNPPGTEQGGFTGTGGGGGSNRSSSSGGKGGGSTSPTPTPATERWYLYHGLYYQGRQAYDEAVAAARASGNRIVGYGSGKNRGYGYGDQGFATMQEAHNARVNALVPIESAARHEHLALDSSKEVRALGGMSVDAIKTRVSAIAETINAARAAGVVPERLVTAFRKDNTQLNHALSEREKWAARVKADKDKLNQDRQSLKDYGQGVTDKLLGGFNINTSGNGYAYGIKASLQNQIDDIKKMRDLEAKAKKLGLDPRLIQQFESEGTSGAANLQALVNGGSTAISGVNAQYAELVKLSNDAGTQAMKDNVEINKEIAADNKKIASDSAKQVTAQREVNRQLTDIRRDTQTMARDLAHALTAARKRA